MCIALCVCRTLIVTVRYLGYRFGMDKFGQNVESTASLVTPQASNVSLRRPDLASAAAMMCELACDQQIVVRQKIGCFVLVKASRGVMCGHIA